MHPRPTLPSAGLTLVGAALVLGSLLSYGADERSAWVIVVGAVAAGCWVLRTLLALVGLHRTAAAVAFLGVATGSLAATGTGSSIVPAVFLIVVVVADEAMPPLVIATLAAVGAVSVGAGAIAVPASLGDLLSMIAVLALGVLGGYSRRQTRVARRQAVALREKEAAAREEAARVAIARDLHDVLAHSLGGLVIQLDAAEALLEAGDAAGAHARVASARELAAGGLGEARRAVAALRAPRTEDKPDVAPAALLATMESLAAAHRALGGSVDFRSAGAPSSLSADQATALERALQEALSNARRHAPGAAVEARLEWQDDGVRLIVSNPVPDEPASASGGYGLVGMRERFTALPLGGTVMTDAADGRFTLTAQARLR